MWKSRKWQENFNQYSDQKIRWPFNSYEILKGWSIFWSENQMNAEFLDFEWHIFKCTRYKLTWYLKELEVYQDFDLSTGRKENLNPKKRERELYSRLKIWMFFLLNLSHWSQFWHQKYWKNKIVNFNNADFCKQLRTISSSKYLLSKKHWH